ncbi:hypothetical protein AB0H76_36240 [Nocardia sp. NPDC050712]|uniref:hypothetical protein n=1 Tax=Nocardia sp. NPDC050712 TaxID=3155518 RepID=UPI0033F147D4
MTTSNIDRRFERLETRVVDIKNAHGESLLDLRQRVTGLEIWADRATDHMNGSGETLRLIAEHLGIRPAPMPAIRLATKEEVEAALEADC